MTARASFLATFAALAGTAVPREVRGQQLTKLRIGSVFADSYGTPFFAKTAGTFARAGFELDLNNMANSGAVAAALGGGSLDLGTGDLISGVNAIIKGVPNLLVAGLGLYRSEDAGIILAVDKNGPIRQPRDLTGKTIGIPTLVGLTTASLKNWLPQNGVDVATVKLVEISQAATVPGLQRGTIDCGLLGEPFLTPNKELIRDVGHPLDAVAKEFVQSVWYAAKAWVDADRERARRAIAAIYETARWCNAHQAETFQILVNEAHLDGEKLKGMVRTPFATGPLTVAMVQPVLTAGYNGKIFDRLIDANTLIAKI
jgi:ABC-type nitrate/sulfonate/bicarbonate transport system substrate-binding protein